jgi:hypothetical protein
MRYFIIPLIFLCLGLSACGPDQDAYVRATTTRPYPLLTDGTSGAEAQTYKAQTIAPPSEQPAPAAAPKPVAKKDPAPAK